MEDIGDNILDLTILEQGKSSIEKLSDIGIDTFGAVLDELKGIPYVDTLIRISQVGLGFINMWFLRKVARFLRGTESISDEEKNSFINGLSLKDKQRISSYIMNLLYISEDEQKAEIMGRVYAARVRNIISYEQMLRLCSVVNKVFVDDLQQLVTYLKSTDYQGYVTDSLYSVGLLERLSSVSEWVDENGVNSMSMGERKYILNDLGTTLYRVLYEG